MPSLNRDSADTDFLLGASASGKILVFRNITKFSRSYASKLNKILYQQKILSEQFFKKKKNKKILFLYKSFKNSFKTMHSLDKNIQIDRMFKSYNWYNYC